MPPNAPSPHRMCGRASVVGAMASGFAYAIDHISLLVLRNRSSMSRSTLDSDVPSVASTADDRNNCRFRFSADRDMDLAPEDTEYSSSPLYWGATISSAYLRRAESPHQCRHPAMQRCACAAWRLAVESVRRTIDCKCRGDACRAVPYSGLKTRRSEHWLSVERLLRNRDHTCHTPV
jgi:hypothetical protein